MKFHKPFLLPFLLLPLLGSCGGQASPKEVLLDFGSYANRSAETGITKDNTIETIAYSKLSSLVYEKRSFLFLVKGSTDSCMCWNAFLNNCLGPYVHAKHLLVYSMTLTELNKESDKYGLKMVDGYDTMAIFEDGKLVEQKCYAEDEKFGYDAPTFNAWMDQRIIAPKVYYVDQKQLDKLYEGQDPLGQTTSRFAIYFGRDTCPDCSYMSRVDLKEYFAQRKAASLPLYYFDCDDWPTEAYAAKKEEYGLSPTKDNPYAYSKGAFPFVASIVPNSGEKIKTIDQVGVFYNDTIKEGVITDSYFSKERAEDPEVGLNGSLSYAAKVNPNILVGQKVDLSLSRHLQLSPYHKPLLFALLDEIL